MRSKILSFLNRGGAIPIIYLFFLLLQKFAETKYAGPVLMVILGIVTLLGIIAAWHAIKTYRAMPHNVDVDVSDQNRPLPLNLQPFIEPLLERGFERLGEYTTVTDGEKEMGTCWCYVDRARTTQLEVVTVRGFPLFQFSSVYPDHAFLETMYPHGEIITTPNYRVRTVSEGTIGTAYEQHLTDLPLFAVHGDPIPIRDIAHSIEIGRNYRKKYGQRKLQHPMQQAIVFPVFFGIFTLMMGILSFSDDALSRREKLAAILGLLNLAFMLVPLLFPGPRWAVRIFWFGMAALLIVLPLILDQWTATALYGLGLCLLVVFYLISTRRKALFSFPRPDIQQKS